MLRGPILINVISIYLCKNLDYFFLLCKGYEYGCVIINVIWY